MSRKIQNIIADIKEQYLESDNNIPWIIGYSGGKDSTVVLSFVWWALQEIREEQGDGSLNRPIFVVNNDTLVENPIITDYVIEVLMKVCHHTLEQAETCAMITHYKGKCSVKSGTYEELEPYYISLLNHHLYAKIQ